MELLIMWLGTILASFGMEIANEMRMFKDVADNGYKIDIKRLGEFTKQINPKNTKTSLIEYFIPLLNIAGVLNRTIQYNNARPMLLDQLHIMDILIPMTKEEEELYQTKPTGFNAFVMTIKSSKDKEIITVSFVDGNEKSSISYTEDKNGNRIIIKAEGPVSQLTIFEQKAKIDELFAKIAEGLKEGFSTEEEMQDFLADAFSKKGNSTIDLSAIPVIEQSQGEAQVPAELSLADQRDQLEQFRNDIITTTQEQSTDEKGQSKSFKPKN